MDLIDDLLKTIAKNWKAAIAPSCCIGKCKLVEGGGELQCFTCGWDENFEPITIKTNTDGKEKSLG